jgi:hypothetical protein
MRELMVNDLRDNGEHEDEEHGDWEEVGDDTEFVLEGCTTTTQKYL